MSITQEYPKRSKGAAYILWFLICFGAGGIHRFYAGKHITGLIYLFTGGFFGLGQLLDLILIPQMIDDFNRRQRLLYGNLAANQVIVNVNNLPTPQLPKIADKPNLEASQDSLIQALLKTAQQTQGKITVTEGVIATGKSFKEVEQALVSIHKAGYASIDNDPVTGVLFYRIDQLAR